MPQIDIEKLKALMTTEKNHRIADSRFHRANVSQAPQLVKNRAALQEAARSYFTKTGLDVGNIDRLLAERQKEVKRVFDEQRKERLKNAAAREKTFRQGLASQREALELLARPPVLPFTPYYLFLDTPFLIWEIPHPDLDLLQDSHVESFGSWVRVNVDYKTGSNQTWFTFYYSWMNESAFPAAVNVYTGLTFNGDCSVTAASGVFSGDKCNLTIDAELQLLEWWNEPVASPLGQSSQNQNVLYLEATGPTLPESFWKTDDSHSQSFDHVPVNLSYQMFRIPPKSVAVFEVSAHFTFGFTSGGLNLSDAISADFASTELNYLIMCPFITLEVLSAWERPQA